ncbi:MAG TPA: response regulator [Candidatus Deferrimicrobium sp.]|nr:response regulator [Candidatus Deferrimicrobium sp.]
MGRQKGKKSILPEYKENPFVTSTAVLGNDFYGREKEIEQVTHFLGKKKEHHLLIHGQRRIGKTSLLLKIKEMVNNSRMGKAIFFDLQNKAKLDISDVLAELTREICLAMDLNPDVMGRDVAGTEAGNIFKDEFLPRVLETLPKNCKLVLLFDEFDSLGDLEGVNGTPKISNIAYHKFIPLIGEIKEKELPLKFIFAVGRNYKDLDEGRYGQITKSVGQIELSYFDKNELERLIRSSDTVLPFEQEAIDRIYTYTSGHPFFSQCLSSTAFDEADRLNAQSVTPEMVDNSLEATIKSHGGGAIWLWQGFLPRDRIVLYLMATVKEEKKPLNERNIKAAAACLNLVPVVHELNDTLERLVNLKIIKKVNRESTHYDFYVEFFRKWILMENSVEKIGMLLTELNPDIKHNIRNGQYYYDQGDFKAAEKWFTAVINKFPAHYEALFYLGQISTNLMDKEKEYLDKALEWFSRAYALNPYGTKDEYLSVLKEKLTRLEENGEETEKILAEIQKVNPGESKILGKENNQDKYPEFPILVVDDEKNFLNSMDFILRSKGISNVECCSDSTEVMPRLKNKKYSVILLDLKMRGITGEELLEKIVEEYPRTPVIILTAIDMVEIAVRCIKKGAFDYLGKPVVTEKLIKTIQDALRLASGNDNK